MAQEYSRPQRVADQIQKELAVLIQQNMKDPRVGMCTVSAVEVSRDLSHAKVFVTFLNNSDNPNEHHSDQNTAIASALKVLNNAASFLRGQLGKRMQLRIVPSIRFHHDESLQRGNYLSNLIDEAIAKDNR